MPQENSVVSISHETPQETESRLRGVLTVADFDVLPGLWTYRQYPAGPPPTPREHLGHRPRRQQLVQPGVGKGNEPEIFGVFAFHFPADQDNSGFVGCWPPSSSNTSAPGGGPVRIQPARGGVYDYWLTPHQLHENAIEHVKRLATPGT